MSDKDPIPDFDDRAPRDRYCDLILTGGVTSAIAYPAAIATLATAYRFNSIGGSSSGAGAAALAAAAEYRRRHGSSDGFRILIERTAAIADEEGGRTELAWLFQPAAQHRRLFGALVPGFAAPKGKKGSLAWGLLRAYAGAALVIAFLVLALACMLSVVQTLPACALLAIVLLAVAAVFAAWTLWRDLGRVARDDFGLCSGFKVQKDAPRPTLVEWLHALIQQIAGRPVDGDPLTFADLAAAPGSPKETMGDSSRPGSESIRLQMFTANVTQGRPYLFPQEDGDTELFFMPKEMAKLFPGSVVEFMKRKSVERSDGYWPLPRRELPIVVAARMSVSFPVLFRAVPLWAFDSQAGRMRRCLFVDGGLCSNFPIHLFDSPIPTWPTFGVSLHKAPDAKADDTVEELVNLPASAKEGQQDRWSEVDRQAGTGAQLGGFVGAMFDTVIDWNDATLARLPGVWDRVVRVGLKDGIGGLNILMKKEQIDHLSKLGGEAARQLLERFAKPSDGAGGLADGWNGHRWVRFNLLRECLSEALSGVSLSAANRHFAQPIGAQIRAAVDKAPPEPGAARSAAAEAVNAPEPLLAAQAAALDGVLAALMQVERALAAPMPQPPERPHPRPQLRVRPPL